MTSRFAENTQQRGFRWKPPRSVGYMAGAATPGSCSGAYNVHDPVVIRRTSNDTYFRFWTDTQGLAILVGSIINLDGQYNLWPSDVAKIGDYYYLFYSMSTFGSKSSAIGVARSSTLDVGTWTDLGSTGISSTSGSAYNSIDANLIPPVKTAGFSTYQGSTIFDPVTSYLFFSTGTCDGYDSSRQSAGKRVSLTPPGKSGGGTTVLAGQSQLYGPCSQGANSGGTILYYYYVETRIGNSGGQK
ncbi:glycoside hydrolase family 43 protein [Tirmania nivea]|nr:glycoside hydrolase family 43 protein [Tirmania nivea]